MPIEASPNHLQLFSLSFPSLFLRIATQSTVDVEDHAREGKSKNGQRSSLLWLISVSFWGFKEMEKPKELFV